MATRSRAAANGNARRKVMRWLKAQQRPCHICGLPIDYAIGDPHDPRHFECDEVVPVSLGGSATDRANVDAAHRWCNEWRGNRMVWSVPAAREGLAEATRSYLSGQRPRKPKRAGAPPVGPIPHSRDW